MTPLEAGAREEKALGKRSRWLGPQPGHWSTTYNNPVRHKRLPKDLFLVGGGTCHSGNTLSPVIDLHTPAAVVSIAPVAITERGALQTGWESVARERASAALDVAAVVGGLAGERAADRRALVDAHGGRDGCESGAGREGDGGEGFGEHVDLVGGCLLLVERCGFELDSPAVVFLVVWSRP